MKTVLLIILAAVVLLLCVFLFTSVFVEICCEKNELAGNFEIFIKYLFIKKKIIPAQKKSNEKKKDNNDFVFYKEKLSEISQSLKKIKKELGKFLDFCAKKLVEIKILDFEFVFGLDDPMYTGIVNGAVYGIVYNILGFVNHHASIEETKIDIVPDFERECRSLKLKCILRLRNAHIIIILIKLAVIYLKLKAKKKKGSNYYGRTRTSDSRVDGYSNVQH